MEVIDYKKLYEEEKEKNKRRIKEYSELKKKYWKLLLKFNDKCLENDWLDEYIKENF